MILSDIIVLVNERCMKNGRWCMCMKEYIANLEKELTLIENGFKEQEKRALADYQSKGLPSKDVRCISLWIFIGVRRCIKFYER